MSGAENEWFRRAFKNDYLFLYSHRTVREATQHISLALRYVDFEKGQRVLDLACGAGRHALAFARRGAKVTGVDLSQVLLEEARARFRQSGLEATFKRHDMRELTYENRFDGVSMWFTSFGYFEDPADDFRVLENIRRALKPDGWWWIDIINPTHLRANLVPETIRELEGPYGRALVTEHRKVTSSQVIKSIEISDDKGERKYVERVRLYQPDKFSKLTERAGLSSQGVLGDYEGNDLRADRPRQIWYGVKK